MHLKGHDQLKVHKIENFFVSEFEFCSISLFFLYIFWGDFFIFFVLYSTLLHLPPLRFHCADGCWDRTQDCCIWCIGSQTL
jgi:hypothetical protein